MYGRNHNVFVEKTNVTFWELSETEIERYLDTGEPFDKAGSYGIQGYGALFVKQIEGDYFSVVGLPVSRLARELKTVGNKVVLISFHRRLSLVVAFLVFSLYVEEGEWTLNYVNSRLSEGRSTA